MSRTVLVLVLVLAITGVSAAAAATDRSGAVSAKYPGQAIQRLIERAEDRVEKRRACRPVPVRPLIDDTPSALLLDTLGILRREQTAEDRVAASRGFPGVGSTYRGYVRIARSASGRAYVIEPGRFTGFFRPRSRACRLALRRLVAGAIEPRPPAFRRRARRMLDLTIRSFWKAPRFERERVTTSDYRPDGGPSGGGGGSDAREIRRRGMFRSTQFSSRSRSVLSGVVPDGVASIDFVFARKGFRGQGRPPVLYPSVFRRTEPVQDNVVGFRVPRRGEDACPARMTWRAADGNVVRVVEGREPYAIVNRGRAHPTTRR